MREESDEIRQYCWLDEYRLEFGKDELEKNSNPSVNNETPEEESGSSK
jgi:hypothetical protein